MRGLFKFWARAVKHSVSYGWGVFGIVSTVLPDLLAWIHKGFTALYSLEPVKWLNDHPVRAHLLCAGLAVLAYLFYAPYRLYKEVCAERDKAISERDSLKIRFLLREYIKNGEEMSRQCDFSDKYVSREFEDWYHETRLFLRKNFGEAEDNLFQTAVGKTPFRLLSNQSNSEYTSRLHVCLQQLNRLLLSAEKSTPPLPTPEK